MYAVLMIVVVLFDNFIFKLGHHLSVIPNPAAAALEIYEEGKVVCCFFGE